MGIALAFAVIAVIIGVAAGKAARPASESQSMLPPPPPPPPPSILESASNLTAPTPNLTDHDLTVNSSFNGNWFERAVGTGQMRDAAERFVADTVSKMNRQWHSLGTFTLVGSGVGTTDYGWNVQVVLHYRGAPLLNTAIRGFIENEIKSLPQVAPRLRSVTLA